MGDGLDAMKYYKQRSKVQHGAPTSEVALSKTGDIIVGKFVDRTRPDYMEMMKHQLAESLGEEYIEVDELVCS
jgi:2-oxoglutarate ferredoxin oxidoreductase subunit beta